MITITPTARNEFKVSSHKQTIKHLTWDEVLGRLALMKSKELNMETTLNFYPETITILNHEGYYNVIHKGKITKGLCWDEMLGQVVSIIHPLVRKTWFDTEQIPLLPNANTSPVS
ncbi:MAG: hypothetical protein ACRC6M_02360 [Microcystaceae cyanobacterium]